MFEGHANLTERFDRRVKRTRAAIVQAFGEIVFTAKYSDIRVGDIVEKADIGRSTFYQHFTGKDDVLITSMDWVLVGLASSARSTVDTGPLEEVLDHIWSHRDRGRNILTGATGRLFAKALTQKFEEAVLTEIDGRDVAFLASPVFTANQLSASTLSLLQTWLSGAAPAPVSTLTVVLKRTAQAIVAAAVED